MLFARQDHLDDFNHALVDYMDADNRKHAAGQQAFIAAARNRLEQNKIDTQERIANRQYQSQDTRTAAEKQASMFNSQNVKDAAMARAAAEERLGKAQYEQQRFDTVTKAGTAANTNTTAQKQIEAHSADLKATTEAAAKALAVAQANQQKAVNDAQLLARATPSPGASDAATLNFLAQGNAANVAREDARVLDAQNRLNAAVPGSTGAMFTRKATLDKLRVDLQAKIQAEGMQDRLMVGDRDGVPVVVQKAYQNDPNTILGQSVVGKRPGIDLQGLNPNDPNFSATLAGRIRSATAVPQGTTPPGRTIQDVLTNPGATTAPPNGYAPSGKTVPPGTTEMYNPATKDYKAFTPDGARFFSDPANGGWVPVRGNTSAALVAPVTTVAPVQAPDEERPRRVPANPDDEPAVDQEPPTPDGASGDGGDTSVNYDEALNS